MPIKQPSPPASTTRIRQLTADERRALDEEAEQVAAEVLTPPVDTRPSGRGRVAAAAHRIAATCSAAARRVRAVMTRDNIDAALDASSSYAQLVVRYGVEAAKEAVTRRVRRAVEDSISSALGGGPATGPTKP